MKKIISVLMIAVMVLSLSMVVFAAEGPSVTASESTPKVEGAVNEAGQKVDVVVEKPELKAGETVQSVAAEALKAAEAAKVDVKDAVAAEVFDVSMKDGSQPDGSVKVTIVRDSKSGDVAAVMYQNETDGSWDSAAFTQNDDGTVTITFKHFCTVVLLVKAPAQAADVTPTAKPDAKPDSSSKEPTSPKTGYD